MKNAIILHGIPSREEYFDPQATSPSNNHWLPWIQKQLLMNGYIAQTPELPKPFEPEYKSWCDVFNQFSVNEETVLIGHSCGAGFLVRWLSENKISVGKVFLVAPWIDLNKELTNGFFDFEIDPELVLRTQSLHIFSSKDDHEEILSSVSKISQLQNAQLITFEDRGHFTLSDMNTVEFPDLLNAIL